MAKSKIKVIDDIDKALTDIAPLTPTDVSSMPSSEREVVDGKVVVKVDNRGIVS